jgi:phage baseplate assembly protein W
MDNIPHIAVPMRLVGIGYAVVEQDTTEEVAGCVKVIASFPLGSRDEAPEFGVRPMEFRATPLDVTDLTQACEQYEPRARLSVAQAPQDSADPTAANVQIVVGLATSED